jgi:hypothetical protein
VNNLFLAARHRITTRVMLWQIFGNLGLMGIAAATTAMPDSHIWQLLITLLLLCSFVTGAVALHTFIVRRLRQPDEGKPIWFGGLLLALWIAIYSLASYLLDPLNDRASQRASYWNAMLGSHLRTIFTEARLLNWQQNAFEYLMWLVLPALFIPIVIETITRGWSAHRNTSRILLRWQYWLTAILAYCVAQGLGSLIDWHPPSNPTTEVISVVLRLTVAYIAWAYLLTYVVALTSELLARNQALRNSAA